MITANGITYSINPHAAQRMDERGITDQDIVEVLEDGHRISDDRRGHHRYEKEVIEGLVIRVIIDDGEKEILTVMYRD